MPVQVPQRRVSGTMKLLWHCTVPLCVTGGTLRDGCSSLRGLVLLEAASPESLFDGCVPLGGLPSGGMTAEMRSFCGWVLSSLLAFWFSCPMVPWDWGAPVHRFSDPSVLLSTGTVAYQYAGVHLERVPPGTPSIWERSTWDSVHLGRVPCGTLSSCLLPAGMRPALTLRAVLLPFWSTLPAVLRG